MASNIVHAIPPHSKSVYLLPTGILRALTRASACGGDLHQDPQHKVKWSTSGLLHLIFPCDCCVTQKCAKDAKFGCWTIWSPSRSSRLRVRPAITPTHPQGKVKCSTSVSFHLILSMQYHLTRRARSREVRLLGGRVPFAFFASSREVAITPTHSQSKVKWSTSGLLHLIFPCDCCVTQKCAKDAKFGCWTIWSPSRSSRLRVRPAITPTHSQSKVKCSTSAKSTTNCRNNASCHVILKILMREMQRR
ncbi:hypothetical protein BN140_3025 [Methanoculleus bourgensis MS2]|uniref:Uncharacterized protein n=1 Tax=Methanoculleus bourgensis (strain ATCC 43281 / DSM 3045 / OCM 15 / MS2) TaxID=1201294 RepID=W6Q8Q3_METBM|nr:hypothetical protein BN140_3025 [Methanoculleus bourgensis MS2]